MDLTLDGKGALHGQLARALKQAIHAGRIVHGSRIPPTREMADLTGLSRTTVVAAYEQLQTEGYLQPKVGSGSYVRAPVLRHNGEAYLEKPLAEPAPPQSRFSAIARRNVSVIALPGARDPDARFAFQYGDPQLSATLSTEWARTVNKVLPYLQPRYPRLQGMPELRAAIATHIHMSRGVACTPDDILIVNGTQQAMDLVARVLLDPGDTVAIEEPHYFALRQVMQCAGATLHGVRVDDEGLCVEALPRRAKLVCVTPSHQFPTGAVLSRARREALLEYADRQDGWILEDDYDGEFRHHERAVESLRALDRHDRVIYVGSFSKTLFPAIRLGFLVMPRALHDDFRAAKYLADFALPTLEQAALTEFIISGQYARHLRRSTHVLAQRRQAMRDAFQLPPLQRLRLTGANSGMHLMAWLDGFDRDAVARLLAVAQQRRLGLYTADALYLAPPRTQALMMGFSTLHAKEIPPAVQLLGECLQEISDI